VKRRNQDLGTAAAEEAAQADEEESPLPTLPLWSFRLWAKHRHQLKKAFPQVKSDQTFCAGEW
jgi:hypothetical protein